MKTTIASFLLTAALFALPAFSFAKGAASNDRAAQLLATNGSVSIAAANFFVERGSWQIMVSTKLGWPSARLADGSWLYRDFAVENSSAKGTLIVRFTGGRVSELILANSDAVAALTAAKKVQDNVLIASGH